MRKHGFKVTVELSSVNRKQSEISVILPRELEVLEAQIRDEINRRVSRGRLTVRVTLARRPRARRRPRSASEPCRLARAYAREITRLARELNLAGPVSLDLLVARAGRVANHEAMADAEDFWPAVEKALKPGPRHAGPDAGTGRRPPAEGSGRAHRRHAPGRRPDPETRAQVPETLPRSAPRAPDPKPGWTSCQLDDDRMLKEVVYFADRSDITEELTRLQSHFQQFDDCLQSTEPVGRTLDFLAQEMNREINTIGSKANDSLISREVVTLKTELEKFREQAQNVE